VNPLDRIPSWPVEYRCDRAVSCATFLLVSGFITDTEREKIHKRMMKKYALAKPRKKRGEGR
jgi:hypothetical protein